MVIFGGNIMNLKSYAFQYPNLFEKIFNGIIIFLGNFATPIVGCYLFCVCMSIFGLSNHMPAEMYFTLLGLSIILGIIFMFKYCFSFKGVTLYSSSIEISTQVLGFGKNRPKITIYYSDIASVFISSYNLRYNRRKARKTFIAGDLKNYVELTLKNGKQYCFTVEEQDDFINEIAIRMKANEVD